MESWRVFFVAHLVHFFGASQSVGYVGIRGFIPDSPRIQLVLSRLSGVELSQFQLHLEV